MVRNAWGLESPPTTDDARADARAYRAAERTLDELARARERGRCAGRAGGRRRCARADAVRSGAPGEPGRVAVLDYERARTRAFDVVFLLGLEEGAFPRRARPSPLLERRRCASELGGRLERADSVARDRYLFYTACTRARAAARARPRGGDRRRRAARAEPVLGRRPRRSSTTADVAARDAAAAALGAHVAARVGAERARAPACGRPPRRRTTPTGATALAAANGWSRRLDRARGGVRSPDGASEPGRLAPFAGEDGVLGDRARAIRRLLVGLARRARDRSEDDRRRAGPDAARAGRAHDAEPLLRDRCPRSSTPSASRRRTSRPRSRCVRRCLDDALESGVRLDLTDLQEAELRHTLLADLEGFLRDEAASRGRSSCRAGSRSRSAPSARRRSSSAGLQLGRRPLALREDRPDRHRPVQRARDRPGLQVGQGRALGARHRSRAPPPDPAVHPRAPRPRRRRAARRRVPRARRAAAHARHAPRERARGSSRVRARTTTSTRTTFWAQVESARERAADERASHPRRRRAATIPRATAARRGATSGRSAGWRERDGRRESDDARSTTSSSPPSRPRARSSSRPARERARRRCSSSATSAPSASAGIDVESILVITYTRKAAGELRSRIRAALVERGRPDLARELDGAWISTIHGFCNRLLRAHPFAVRSRSALPRARGGGRGRAARRGVRARARGVLRDRRARAAAAARDVPRATGCGACSRASTRRCARQGAISCSSSVSARASTTRSTASAPRPRRSRPTSRRRETQRRQRERGAAASRRTGRRPSGSSISRRSQCRGRARSVVRAGAQGRRARGARGARRARPRSPAGAARALRRRVRGGEATRVGGRLRGSPARGPRPASRRRVRSARRRSCGSGW